MPDYKAPGVYVEETPLTPTIVGVGTSTAGFIGVVPDDVTMPNRPDDTPYTVAAPQTPVLVTSFDQFKRSFGDFQAGNAVLAHSIYGFFNNGGSACWVGRVADIDSVNEVRAVLQKFDAIDEIAMVAAPGALSEDVQAELIAHCEDVNLQDRFAILDGQRATTVTLADIKGGLASNSSYAAMYFPWVQVFDPITEDRIFIPPSGLMAGVYARVDAARGVHKAPANEVVRGAVGLEYRATKAEQAGVNLDGINVIRTLNGVIRVWGARTLGSADSAEIAYINIRRLMNFLRESIDEGTQFAVFEPNSNPLWATITRSVTSFLTRVWRDGALFGTQPEQAFFVRCDESTNPADVRAAGMVVTEIGVAPVTPAEFVIFRIAQFSEIPAS
jgi:phage tail sheath protein FI